jgi:polyhydroxybutyrate depolymerase
MALMSRLIGCASAIGLVLVVTACSSSHHPVSPAAPTAPAAPQAAVGAIRSAGCQVAPSAKVTNQRDTLTVGGSQRNYLLTTPAPHQLPDPVVVDFHGYGEGAATESLTTQFGALGQRDGFIVVFPNGTGTPIAWDTSTKPNNLDVRFVAQLLDHLEATQCVDEARIYATGLSQGAFMTSTMACVMSQRFAAVAPVAGVELPTPCPTTRPVPILAFHGTADPILHFNGGIGRKVLADDLSAHPHPLPKLPRARLNGPGYPAHVKAWAAKDRCGTTASDTRPTPQVIHRVYPCPAGVAVEFDIILGGGHSWPGSTLSAEIASFVGPTTMEINATSVIWAFFQRFHLTKAPGAT